MNAPVFVRRHSKHLFERIMKVFYIRKADDLADLHDRIICFDKISAALFDPITDQ